jgi:hypothetical protein
MLSVLMTCESMGGATKLKTNFTNNSPGVHMLSFYMSPHSHLVSGLVETHFTFNKSIPNISYTTQDFSINI